MLGIFTRNDEVVKGNYYTTGNRLTLKCWRHLKHKNLSSTDVQIKVNIASTHL